MQESKKRNSLINALNDLDKGQKEVLNAINKLADKPGQYQNNQQINNGDRVSTSGSESHAHTAMQSNSHIYSKSSKPTMPQFLDSPTAG